MNFGLLIAAGDPLSGYYLNAFLTKNLTPSIIIIDEKEYSKRDHEIHKERTGNQLPSLDLNKITENIKVYSVDNHNSKKCIEIIDQHKVGILINAGTPRIIKEALLNSLSIGVINAHPGILPYYRGCTCVEWAIYNNHPIGVTVHLMSEGIDEGEIISAAFVDLSKATCYKDVRVSVYKESFHLLADSVRKILNSDIYDSDFLVQKEGLYWNLIDENKMKVVIKKLNSKPYKHQIRRNISLNSMKNGELDYMFTGEK